jgi:agmatine deiminase
MQNIRQPAEWEKHRATWLAWPFDRELWQENTESAQAEFTALCQAIAWNQSENLEILVPAKFLPEAKSALAALPVRFHSLNYGDIWLRDTAPIFVKNHSQHLQAQSFAFNGWGGKYVLPGDNEVSKAVAGLSGKPTQKFDFVLEGGSLETDGQGTVITTRQCLLNTNRWPRGTTAAAADLQKKMEHQLLESLGFEKIIWLNTGLRNDHTDGHVDNLARFVAPGHVVCMKAQTKADPNAEVLEHIYQTLCASKDAQGRGLKVEQIPSVGPYKNSDGEFIPASYMNFFIANTSVIVPQYGTEFDSAAVTALARVFPDRRVLGLSSRAILSGGGSFHCITQQEPL